MYNIPSIPRHRLRQPAQLKPIYNAEYYTKVNTIANNNFNRTKTQIVFIIKLDKDYGFLGLTPRWNILVVIATDA